jgi:lysylphosphatidylglycerol synthetase-like protein (DUF2156 family)
MGGMIYKDQLMIILLMLLILLLSLFYRKQIKYMHLMRIPLIFLFLVLIPNLILVAVLALNHQLYPHVFPIRDLPRDRGHQRI